MFILVFLNLSVESTDVGRQAMCNGTFIFPAGCTGSGCTYNVTWFYNSTTDNINFLLDAEIGNGMWTGIGFSRDPRMENMDLILADTSGVVQDGYVL